MPNPLPVVGGSNGTWGTLLNTYLAALPTRVADTGASGFALVNGTPTITGMTWTAPSDGNLHMAILVAALQVTSAETGGEITFNMNTSPSSITIMFNPGFGTGFWTPLNGAPGAFAVPPGNTVTVQQATALTAGASTLYAQIWAV